MCLCVVDRLFKGTRSCALRRSDPFTVGSMVCSIPFVDSVTVGNIMLDLVGILHMWEHTTVERATDTTWYERGPNQPRIEYRARYILSQLFRPY